MKFTAHSLGLFHIVPVVFLVIFTFLFAYFFILCESDEHAFERLRSERTALIKKARNTLIQNLRHNNYSLAHNQMSDQYFQLFEESMNCSTSRFYEEELRQRYDWSIRNSLFFVASLMSTIGYGNSVPRTAGGRLLCFPCAILGIPLFFYVVSNWGYLFYDGITAMSYFLRAYCCRRRAPAQTKKKTPVKLNNADQNLAQSQGAMEGQGPGQRSTTKAHPVWSPFAQFGAEERAVLPHQHRIGESFSLALVLVIFVLWLLLTAIIYTFWEENWHYLKSVYFLFLSVTTIGLGDVVPKTLHVKMWSFPILLIGFAVLFMLLAAAQANIETVYRHIWYLLQVHYQRTIPDPPDLIGFESLGQPLLARGTPRSDISRIVRMLPLGERFIYHALVSNTRKEFLGMRWAFLRSRKNQCVQASEPGARKLSWSRPVQFGANEKFPRPIKSVNFDESYLQPGVATGNNSSTGNIYKAPSLDATSSISFTTAVSHFAALSEAERASMRTSEGDVSANAPPCCFITEGTYQSPKKGVSDINVMKNYPY